MEHLDKHEILDLNDEEDLFLREVIQDDHELLYLDSYLREVLTADNLI